MSIVHKFCVKYTLGYNSLRCDVNTKQVKETLEPIGRGEYNEECKNKMMWVWDKKKMRPIFKQEEGDYTEDIA